jgi:hypothetical protein
MGPRATSVTRVSAALSLVALAAVALSDFLLTGFWDRNAMVTSVVADVLVLIVGVAVVNEFLSARARREWRLLSDYGLVELGEVARHTWVMLAQQIGVGQRESLTLSELRELVHCPQGEGTLRELALAVATDESRRRSLHELVADLAENARARLRTVGAGACRDAVSPVDHPVRAAPGAAHRLDLELLDVVEHPDLWGWGAKARGEEAAG